MKKYILILIVTLFIVMNLTAQDFSGIIPGEIGKRLSDYENAQVVRLDDPTGRHDISLRKRVIKANANKVDVLVSVHHNAFRGKWGSHGGAETYTYLGNYPKTEKLAKILHSKVLKAYGLANRGLKKADFYILRKLGFMFWLGLQCQQY